MGRSVEVVTSELQRAAERLRGAGQRLQEGLSSVDLETDNLLGSGWQGEAGTAFERYWDQWHNGAGQVIRAVEIMSTALDVAARNYAVTDENAGQALGATMDGGDVVGSGGAGSGAAATGSAGAPTGSAAATGAVSQADLAERMNLGQVTHQLSPAAGLPVQVASGLAQVGQLAVGAVRQAVQIATELAQPTDVEAGENDQAVLEKAPVERAAEPASQPPAAREL
ncbi:WXG100 family type VII secretion target [Mycolicibacterium sp.]|uniref:WXG100 family type VII secretion target n=1 Tax=Mycolicibacterium sp. TaxID=2320850 RepID=UPI003D0B1B60